MTPAPMMNCVLELRAQTSHFSPKVVIIRCFVRAAELVADTIFLFQALVC